MLSIILILARKALFLEAATEYRNKENTKVINRPIRTRTINCRTITEADEDSLSIHNDDSSLGIDRTLSSRLFMSSDDEDYLASISEQKINKSCLKYSYNGNDTLNVTCFDNANQIYADLMSIDRVF